MNLRDKLNFLHGQLNALWLLLDDTNKSQNHKDLIESILEGFYEIKDSIISNHQSGIKNQYDEPININLNA